MNDLTAKEQICLLDIMIENLWLFLDRMSLLTTAGDVGRNSSAHVARSVAAIWLLSQLNICFSELESNIKSVENTKKTWKITGI